jgi:hypothetical protein
MNSCKGLIMSLIKTKNGPKNPVNAGKMINELFIMAKRYEDSVELMSMHEAPGDCFEDAFGQHQSELYAYMQKHELDDRIVSDAVINSMGYGYKSYQMVNMLLS